MEVKPILNYLVDRTLEHGSLSAYCFAIIGAWDDSLPWPAKLAIFVAATIKFLMNG